MVWYRCTLSMYVNNGTTTLPTGLRQVVAILRTESCTTSEHKQTKLHNATTATPAPTLLLTTRTLSTLPTGTTITTPPTTQRNKKSLFFAPVTALSVDSIRQSLTQSITQSLIPAFDECSISGSTSSDGIVISRTNAAAIASGATTVLDVF